MGGMFFEFERHPSQTARAFTDVLRYREGYRVRGQEKADVVGTLMR